MSGESDSRQGSAVSTRFFVLKGSQGGHRNERLLNSSCLKNNAI